MYIIISYQIAQYTFFSLHNIHFSPIFISKSHRTDVVQILRRSLMVWTCSLSHHYVPLILYQAHSAVDLVTSSTVYPCLPTLPTPSHPQTVVLAPPHAHLGCSPRPLNLSNDRPPPLLPIDQIQVLTETIYSVHLPVTKPTK